MRDCRRHFVVVAKNMLQERVSKETTIGSRSMATIAPIDSKPTNSYNRSFWNESSCNTELLDLSSSVPFVWQEMVA